MDRAVSRTVAGAAAIAAIMAVLVGTLFLAACERIADEGSFEVGKVERATVLYVVDGDTIQVRIGGAERRVRLIGVDAPESVHPDETRNTAAGDEAAAHLEALVSPGDSVWLEKDESDTDAYGRLLRYVWVADPGGRASAEDVASSTLNGLMVSSGYAVPAEFLPDVKYAEVWRDTAPRE